MRSFIRNSVFRSLRLPAAGLLAAGILAAALAACSSEESTGPADDGLITLTRPVGGETFKVGDTIWFEWTTKEDLNDPVDAVDPMLSPDDGKTWVALRNSIALGTPSWGRWGYAIPESLYIASSNTRVQLRGNTQVKARVRQYAATDARLNSTSKTTLSIAP